VGVALKTFHIIKALLNGTVKGSIISEENSHVFRVLKQATSQRN